MEKTRNLSVATYFSVIQQEYLIAEFRRKIYYKPKDKNYYQRVMGFKKEKIENIAKRNNLESIFTSQAKMEQIRSLVFDKSGRPNFEMNETDIANYYATGNEFAYNGQIWTLDQVCDNGEVVLYSMDLQRFEKVKKDEICRIL